MPTRITLKDERLFPVQAFFNAIADSSLVQVVDHLTKGIGYSVHDAHCRFPADIDPGEEPFDGVRFSLFEDSVVIGMSQLHHFLAIVSNRYSESHPKDKEVLNQLLQRK
jgi:hypothetical protein